MKNFLKLLFLDLCYDIFILDSSANNCFGGMFNRCFYEKNNCNMATNNYDFLFRGV